MKAGGSSARYLGYWAAGGGWFGGLFSCKLFSGVGRAVTVTAAIWNSFNHSREDFWVSPGDKICSCVSSFRLQAC